MGKGMPIRWPLDAALWIAGALALLCAGGWLTTRAPDWLLAAVDACAFAAMAVWAWRWLSRAERYALENYGKE